MIYSIISLMLISAFSNKTILGQGESKTFYIYSKKYEEIKDYLHNVLKIDTTEFECIGAYKNEVGKMLLTIVDNTNYYLIKEIIKTIDEKAFIVITDSYHLINANVSINK